MVVSYFGVMTSADFLLDLHDVTAPHNSSTANDIRIWRDGFCKVIGGTIG
jgi:hypothetical protein